MFTYFALFVFLSPVIDALVVAADHLRRETEYTRFSHAVKKIKVQSSSM